METHKIYFLFKKKVEIEVWLIFDLCWSAYFLYSVFISISPLLSHNFLACHASFERFLRVNRFHLSCLYHDFQTNSGTLVLCFLMFDVLHQWIRLNELYKLSESFLVFSNFEFIFEFLAENRNFFKRITRREYWWNCNVLYINGFVSTSSTN